MCNCENCGRLCVVGFGVALGVTWAVGLFALGMAGLFFGYGVNMIAVIGEMYIGYAPTVVGSVLGALWGFVDLFVTGVLIAFVYNFVCGRCCKKVE